MSEKVYIFLPIGMGIMVNYYYEIGKIVKNHEDFVNKGKISIMDNLKEHV
jgi:hypothetical protein